MILFLFFDLRSIVAATTRGSIIILDVKRGTDEAIATHLSDIIERFNGRFDG